MTVFIIFFFKLKSAGNCGGNYLGDSPVTRRWGSVRCQSVLVSCSCLHIYSCQVRNVSTILLVCINATSGTHRRLQSEPRKSKLYIQAFLASSFLTARHEQIKRAFGEKLRAG